MAQEVKSVEENQDDRRPFFKGYPYLVIRMASLRHINLLSSEQNNPEDLFRLAQTQADANKLEVCLVLNENTGVYFLSKSEPRFSDQIPKGGILETDRLPLSVNQLLNVDLLQRKKDLETFMQSNKSTGYLVGGHKGGRKATEEEIINLKGVQGDGLPNGLESCSVCGDYRGECLDPSPIPEWNLVIRVFCYCDNDNLCAYCGRTLYDRKLNSCYYKPADGKFWYVPSFAAMNHKCSETLKKHIGV